MKKLNTYIALILVMSLFACNGQQSSDANQSTKTEEATATVTMSSQPISVLDEVQMDEIMLIDVRTPEEYQAGHVENALNINFFDENFTDQIKDLNTDKTLYLYCRSGKRSMNASKALSALGYKVVNLEGGYNAYSASK
jgi:rhodanese-related sulfurtransferase